MISLMKRRIYTFVLIAAMTLGTFASSTIYVYAASASASQTADAASIEALKTYKGNTKEFNAYDYYMNNPDLQTAIGADGDALLKHFNESGKKEGRIAIAASTTTVSATHTATKTSKSSGTASGNSNGFDTYNIPEQQNTEASYVLNTNTKKFHYPSCKDVAKIKPSNYSTSSSSRDDIIAQGYSPCGHCKP